MAFEEPVGIFVPDQVVKEVAGFGEAVIVKEFLDSFAGLVDLIANPIFAVVVDGELFVSFRIIINELLNEAGDIPEFVAKVATSDNFAGTEGLVDAGRATSNEAEAEGVRAVFADDFDRINDVTFRLGHFLAFFIKDHAVHIDVSKWHIAGNVETEHNHAADPLE